MIDFSTYLDRELPLINGFIDRQVEGLSVLVRPLAGHVFQAGGKRLRPLLTILTARCLGVPAGVDIYPLACALEFLHSATLLHDDILDNAELRRGLPAAHVVYGTTETILAGDVLLALANRLVAEYGLPALSHTLSDAILRTVIGEIDEIARARKPDLSREEYLEIITGKTAYLLQASCRVGAIVAGAGPVLEERASALGLNLGIAFQLVDDALDYDARPDVSGKPSGLDLHEGKLTLPLILYLESLPEDERDDLVRRLADHALGEDEIQRIITAVAEGGYSERTKDIAASYIGLAEEALAAFPDNMERAILEQALGFILVREK